MKWQNMNMGRWAVRTSGPYYVVVMCISICLLAGPGPVPRLDGINIPFGRVLEGMGVVGQITQVRWKEEQDMDLLDRQEDNRGMD